MAWFTVQYRGPGGKTESVQIDAADRAGVFAELKKRGISAISVREGAAKKSSSASPMRGLVAGLIVIICAIGIAIYLMPRAATTASEKERSSKKIKDVTPPMIDCRTEVAVTEDVVDQDAVALNLGTDLTQPKMVKKELTPEEWYRVTNRTFRAGVEQLMSWVFTTEIGSMPIPVPKISEEDRKDIVSILISKSEIKENDDAITADCKETLNAAKKEMLKYLKAGGDPDEFLDYYFQELRYAFELRSEALRKIDEMGQDDPVMCKEYFDKVNEMLREKGIKEIREAEIDVLDPDHGIRDVNLKDGE